MDDDLASMLDAHVRFEVDRWSDDALPASVAREVGACFDWLEATALNDVAPPDLMLTWLRRVILEEPAAEGLIDGLAAEIEWALRTAHESLREETVTLAEALPQASYRLLVEGAVAQARIRREIVDQLTASAVYAQLISHVLYHGVKDYVLTENAVVRNVPGASSLLRMGQNAVRSASPGLEASIDRRLIAFVASNVSETVRDSQEFLDTVLDDATFRTIAGEVWATNGPRSVGDLTALLDPDVLGEVVATGRDVWSAVRSGPVVGRVLDAVVEQFYRAHGGEPVAAFLGDLGITREVAASAVAQVVAPAVAAARDAGHLEAWVRGRLTEFYATYTPKP